MQINAIRSLYLLVYFLFTLYSNSEYLVASGRTSAEITTACVNLNESQESLKTSINSILELFFL